MAGSVMKISETYDKEVYTDDGVYFGKIGDVVLGKYMIHGWVVKSTPNSLLQRTLGGVKAVIVPHKAVKAIGDIMIIVHSIEISEESEGVQAGAAGKKGQEE
jgi:sporulation protein YlmC with PRC-barrel domain